MIAKERREWKEGRRKVGGRKIYWGGVVFPTPKHFSFSEVPSRICFFFIIFYNSHASILNYEVVFAMFFFLFFFPLPLLITFLFYS